MSFAENAGEKNNMNGEIQTVTIWDERFVKERKWMYVGKADITNEESPMGRADAEMVRMHGIYKADKGEFVVLEAYESEDNAPEHDLVTNARVRNARKDAFMFSGSKLQ